jgi:AraC-like DNA-binding protein
MKCSDGFRGGYQIKIPEFMLNKVAGKKEFLHSLFITDIGNFLNARYHFLERKNGCNNYILLYCLHGKGSIENQYGKLELLQNQFIIIPPNEFHRFQANIDDPWSIYWVHFNSNQLEKLSHEINLEDFCTPTNIIYNEQILDVWHQMYESLSSGYTTINILNANMYLYRFLCFFLFQNEFLTDEREGPLEKSIQFMKANISKRLMVDEIASYVQYSPSHYTALFKKKTGMAPLDYFIKMKIRYACQLLTKNELKVKEVAERAGYDDPYFFSKIFKQVTGKSPKEYRQVKSPGFSKAA